MASVDTLLYVGQRLLCYRKNLTTIEYLWLGLHNSVNLTVKESDEQQRFLQAPIPTFHSCFLFPFPLNSSYPDVMLEQTDLHIFLLVIYQYNRFFV